MQVAEAPQPPVGLWKLLKVLLVLLIVDLAVLMVLVFLHAYTSQASLIVPAPELTVGFAGFSLASLGVGGLISWRQYPKHRRALVFVAAVTTATLLAHLFIIGLPAAGSQGAFSGAVGGQIQDDKLVVSSSISEDTLNVTVTAGGSDAIAQVNITAPGLGGPGFATPPTYASPLEPTESTTGSFSFTNPPTTLNVTYQYLTCYSTNSKTYGCIMDEVFYVPEAQGILNGDKCSTIAPNCHLEHPWLAPGLFAAGMAIFGAFNVVGWRIIPALMGTLSVGLVFGIAWKLSEDKRVAYFATILFGLDVMFFSQSSAALLDVPMLFFGLAAVLVYLTKVKVWKLDNYLLAAILLGLAGLAKETAVFFVAGLLTYHLLAGKESRLQKVRTVMKMAIVIGLVFVVGLQAYDSTLTPTVPTFVNHVEYIWSYGSSLKADKLACQPTTGYWCKFPNDAGGPAILPTDWLLYYTPVEYYATSVSVCPNTVNGVCQGGAYSYVALAYYGVTNLIETWTTFVWLPLGIFAMYVWWRASRKPDQTSLDAFAAEPVPKREMTPEVRYASFAVIMFLWTYVPYLFLLLGQRVTYPFYFIPAIPAVSMGAAYFISRSWFSPKLVPIYIGMAFVFFFVYFPDKSFLPDWLRVLIGH
jgi:Dolichyl-phosphate-mannose-protein mannosyltransferase